jgi:Concanavalin A-like lectin/glucanases superfamily
MRGKRLVLGLGVVLAVAIYAPSASAATLVADYQFQGDFSSSAGSGADLSPLGNANQFPTETVGCNQSKVLTFPKGSGLQVAKPGGPTADSDYSLVMLFRLSDLSGYRAIFHPDSQSGGFNSDNGLYERNGQLALYDGGPFLSPTAVIKPNTYAEVALTFDDSKSVPTRVFFNGSLAVEHEADSTAFYANVLRFFKDNDGSNGDEDSAGAVARIRVFSGALLPAEVASIFDNSPIAGGCNPALLAKAAVNGKVKVKKAGKRYVVLTGIDASCPDGGPDCTGSAKITKGAKAGRASVSKVPKKLGKSKLSVAAGKTQAVKIKLTKKASKALRNKGKLKATISVSLSADGGNPAIASRTAKLKAP